MALISYNQQDDAATYNAGCSGQADGITTAGRVMDLTALGTTEFTVDPDNLATAACAIFESPAPNVASWAAGDFVVRVNITTVDADTQFVRIDICDNNGGTYATVTGGGNHVPTHTRGATGVVTETIATSAYTPQSQANSTVFIVLTFNSNAPHGNSTVAITPDQIVDTPIDDGVGAAASLLWRPGMIRRPRPREMVIW